MKVPRKNFVFARAGLLLGAMACVPSAPPQRDAGKPDSDSGSTCYAGDICPLANSCHVGTIDCSSGVPTCQDTGLQQDGTVCGNDQVCSNGDCIACASGVSCAPSNPCHAGAISCDTGTPVCADTGLPAADGTSCGSGQVCSSGSCVACTSGLSCTPANACDVGTLDCSSGSPVCVDTGTPVPNGTSCGSGQVCSQGGCVACNEGASCAVSNPCHQGSISCASGAAACVDTGQPVADGTACGGSEVCSGGSCVACASGASCTPANPCDQGTLDCSTGTPVCNDTGSARINGTPCGSGHVCSGSVCVACDEGAACKPSNPCDRGSISCASGGPVCVDSNQPVADGTACGSGEVCSGGSCVACASGSPCTPSNPCDQGQIACGTGTAVCQDLGTPVSNGTSCGAGRVCSAGTCVACVAGSACTPPNPCDVGSVSCASGTPVCVDTGTPNSTENGASCGTGEVCSNGSCVACVAGSRCTPANPCDLGTLSCSSGSPSCADTGQANPGANGNACGSGEICAAGSCQSGCWIGGAFIAAGAVNPTNGCQSCQPLISTQGWSNQTDGTSCGPSGSGEVCSSGTCGCSRGDALCSSTCTAVSTDNANCGSCGNVCGAGTNCFGGQCTTVTPMPNPSWALGAAVAPNGQIYCLGGTGNGGFPGNPNNAGGWVQVYDPATNQWNASYNPPGEPMGTDFAPAAVAADGRVYLLAAGSGDGNNNSVGGNASSLIYALTPGASQWSSGVGYLQNYLSGFAAATGADGKIYLFGGFDSNNHPLSQVEIYDSSTHTSTLLSAPAAQMPTARGYAAAVTANDGRIYVIGGASSLNLGVAMTTVEIFDPATQTWSTGVPLPKGRAQFGAALGSDGRIYVAGNGLYNSGACSCTSAALTACADATTAAFDPQKNAWVATANLNVGRVAPSMVAGHDGRLYVFGGYGAYYPSQNGACQGALGTVEVYAPGIDAWTL